MNRSILFVSSFLALSAAIVACSGDDEAKPAGTSSNVVETPPSNTSTSDGSNVTPAPTPVPTTPPPVPTVTADAGPPPPPASWETKIFGNDLALWLDSDSIVTDQTGAVTAWKDKSGHANDALPKAGQATTSTFLSRKGVQFSGAQSLTIKDDSSLQFSADFTIMVIYSSTQAKGSYGALYGKTTVASPYTGPVLFTNYPLGASADKGALGMQLDLGNVLTSSETDLDTGNVHIAFIERQGDQMLIQLDTDPATTSNDKNLGDTKAVGVDPYIGGHPGSGQNLTGSIYEIVAMPKAATDKQRANAYLETLVSFNQ